MLPVTFHGVFPIILTFGGIQGMILAWLLVWRSRNKFTGVMMAIFLLSYAMPTLNFAFLNSSIGAQLPSRVVLQPFILLFGPSFYFFIKASHQDLKDLSAFLLHAIPFFGFSILEGGAMAGLFNFEFDYHFLNAASAIVYSILVIGYYNQSSGGRGLTLSFEYLQIIMLCFCLYVLFTICFLVLLMFDIGNRLLFVYLFGTLITLLVYSMGFIAYWHSSSQGKKLIEELNAGEIEKIRAGLEHLVTEKFYLVSKVHLHDVANRLHTSPRYVSRFINDEMGISFPDFINRLRIDEAKQIISKSTANPKMLAVALDSGFSNKVTFNKQFKKHTGCTPHQFKVSYQRSKES